MAKGKINFYELEREKRAYYRDQVEAAKEAFKQERGLKIARGFGDSPEAKRIARNEKRAIRRLEKKKIQAIAVDNKRTKRGGAKVLFREMRENRNQFFWEVLTAGPHGSSSVVFEWRTMEALGKIPGVTLFGVVIDYEGNRTTYFSEFGFVRALSELAKEAAKLQVRKTITTKDSQGNKVKRQKTTYYPMVNFQIAEDSEGRVYLIVEGVR